MKQKAQEEKREEAEMQAMAKMDTPYQQDQQQVPPAQPVLAGSAVAAEASMAAVPTTGIGTVDVEEELVMSFLENMVPQEDLRGMEAPVTPPMASALASSSARPPSPRTFSTHRTHDDDVADDGHEAKKAKVEVHKKQRIDQVKETYSKMTVGDDEFFTMDSYETDYNSELDDLDDVWTGEDALQFNGVPEAFWSDSSTDRPPDPPEHWVDKLADEVEISRLLDMGVLQKRDDFAGEVSGNLTTRFVYDWRLKNYDGGEAPMMRWMRRSRFVAREFANTKRHDTYSPATGSHTNNLIPLVYLQMLSQMENSGTTDDLHQCVLASMDIKDAFLQVPQENVVEVTLHGSQYVVLKNLPGQRMGAKAWYWHFRRYATEALGFTWSPIQPCIAKCGANVFMLHVDDLLFTGQRQYWQDVFLPAV